ncbi:MAG: TolC family protein [Magnetococcales bacterium]|nr:TolC family protein [Magnetococcales bacterium]NGZ27381.1 TolC family protein [Magnetococcales bacterium]
MKVNPLSKKRKSLLALGMLVAMVMPHPESLVWAEANLTSNPPVAAGKWTLKSYIQQVLNANHTVASQQMSEQIAMEGVNQAKGAFEPVAKMNVQRSSIRQKNTAEEDLVRQNLGIYSRKNSGYDIGGSALIPTGATIEAKLGVDAIDSNLQAIANRPREFKSFYDLSVTQPLLRDAGVDITMAKTRIAEKDAAVAGLSTLEVNTSVVSSAISAYLDLRMAQERQRIWEEGLRTAEGLVKEARLLDKQGRLSETALIDVENGLILYQVGVSEARQQVEEAMGKARTLLMVTAQDSLPPLTASDPLPKVDKKVVSFQESMQTALTQRADYRSRLVAMEREGIRIAYAENQTLPRIDLVASYGINGLEYNGNKVYSALENDDFPTWKVGVQMSTPIMGNEAANAQLRVARLNKAKALLEAQGLETSMANDITTALSAMENSRQRWEMYQQLLKAGSKQLTMEKQLLAAGRSDRRNVLSREESMVRNRVSLAEQAVAYVKAKVALEVARGTLLANFTDLSSDREKQ